MRKGRFSQEQIIAILREQEAGMATAEVCRRHGISSATVLRLEVEVRRARGVGGQAPEDARGREPQAEEAVGRADARQRHAQRAADKNLLTPAARRTVVSWAIEEKDYSQLRACALIGLAPKGLPLSTAK